MVFSSLTFLLLFLPLLLLLYFVINKAIWRNSVLLIFSLLFYAWGEPRWIVCMLGATLINYICAIILVKQDRSFVRKIVLAVGIIASVAALVYFKYASFILTSFSQLLHLNWDVPPITLPIGISFYTFQILTYTVDVYRGKAQVQRDPLKLLLYVSCFPQLIAGPIVQYSDIEAQLDSRKTKLTDFSEGMGRFVVGLSKKVLLANLCGKMVEELLGVSGALSVAGAWLSALMYTFQIYFDFSAYSDMAIGLGRVLGFTYKENFDYPYMSTGVSEFWRRWHISLGSFFRDYVYIPLGGNRAGTVKTIRNLLIVWGLTGFWHGASWNFLVWGVYYGVLIILERYVLRRWLECVPNVFKLIGTLFVVILGWILFYYTDMSLAIKHILALLGIGSAGFADANTVEVFRTYTWFPLIAAICCFPIIPRIKNWSKGKRGKEFTYTIFAAAGRTCLLVLSLVFLVGQSYNPFIYFRF